MMLQAEILPSADGLRHAFFTREGGVSKEPFASLNCGFSSGDEAALVTENRARAVRRLGLSPDQLCTARQVHGTKVLIAREPSPGKPSIEADALVTDRIGLALGVLSADCAPVLLADADAGVIGAAHAGWRGALAGVAEAALDAMVELGADRSRIVAAIGPCIAKASYEVGPEVREQFVGADPDSAAHFEPVFGSDRLLLDLKGHVRRRLVRAGVVSCEVLPQDTAADEDRFFSHRRTRRNGGERFGLLLSAIALLS
jgi:YfiH family protein